ncbi:MAG: molybdopterin-dependent oxidoreductase [Crocinitomicaceae bacterium]
METNRKEYTFCRICESLCGLEVEFEGDQIKKILPDTEHVTTRGFACPKGLKQHHLFNSPDRLKFPMKRIGKEWIRISWDQAMAEIGVKVKKIRKEYSPQSIGMYVGTAAGFSVLHPVFAQGFMDAIGSKSMYASATQDCSNKFAVSEHMYGFPFTLPHPDILNTNCFIVVGANPVVSKWSFLQVPNPSLHLKEMERRGCKLYFVDPRKTESAKVAGQHIFIRPGTDVYFYLAFLNELIRIGGVDESRVQEYMKNFDEIKKACAEWTPEKAEKVTQMPADTLRQMVADYHQADGASLYCSTGVNMGGMGVLAFWIQEVINAVSGNLDRKGGTLVGKGVIDFPKFGAKNGLLMQDARSRIGNHRKVNDAYPGGVLADEILTPGEGQLKAMFITGGNPLITMANSNKLRKAFQELELLVTLDILPNETGSLAHYMLPCTSPLERSDLPFIFPLMLGLQTKPYLQATKPILPPVGEVRDEATIYLDLCKASGVNLFGSRVAQLFMENLKKLRSFRQKEDEQPALPQEFLLHLLLKVTGQPGFKKILKNRHGLMRNPHEIGSFLGSRVYTNDQKVDLSPKVLMDQFKKIEDEYDKELNSAHIFKLITKRHVNTHNSWTHNFEEFVSGEFHTNYLYIHPSDAAELGLENKDLVDVSSKTATVRLPVKFLEDLMPKTVALPHGWGHQSSRQKVANKTKGVNVNVLAADGPDQIEEVSGMAHLTGIPVKIEKAKGKQAHSWSGLEQDILEV